MPKTNRATQQDLDRTMIAAIQMLEKVFDALGAQVDVEAVPTRKAVA